MTRGGGPTAQRLRTLEASEDVQRRFATCLNSNFLVCEFAKGANDRELLDYNVLWKRTEHTAAVLDEMITVATERRKMCIVIMPSVKSDAALARLLAELRRGSRWSVGVREGAGVGRSRAVDVLWSDGEVTASVMGFFPGGRMPVTRRAPYTAIAVWAVGPKNIHRRLPGDVLGPGDMPVPDGLDASNYRVMRERIVARLESARDGQHEATIRDHTSFCVGESALRAAGLID